MIGQWLASMHPDFSHWIWGVVGVLLILTGLLLDREPKGPRRLWIVGGSLLLVILLVFFFGFRANDVNKETPEEKSDYPGFCFTVEHSRLTIDEGKLLLFGMNAMNNTDSIKTDIASRLFLLDWSLDQNTAPLYISQEIHPNPEGPGGDFEHVVGFKIGLFSLPLYAVFEVRCMDGISEKPASQIEFMKIGTEAGILEDAVYSADIHEKARIEEYMRKRGIPLYKALVYED